MEFAGIASSGDPRTYKQAMASPDAAQWYKAAEDEFVYLQSVGTWEVVDLPDGSKAIGCGWVFKLKRNADGSIERYKA